MPTNMGLPCHRRFILLPSKTPPTKGDVIEIFLPTLSGFPDSDSVGVSGVPQWASFYSGDRKEQSDAYHRWITASPRDKTAIMKNDRFWRFAVIAEWKKTPTAPDSSRRGKVCISSNQRSCW